MNTQIRWLRNIAVIEIGEIASSDSLQQILDRLYGHPQSDKITGAIIDFQQIREFNLEPNDALLPAAYDIGHSSHTQAKLKYAFVTRSDRIIAFLNKYKSILERGQTRIDVQLFDSRDAAESWVER